MRKNELCLLPHDSSWKNDFSNERDRIVNVVNDSSIYIEHVGSTAIATVYAKPILDIAILCDEKKLNLLTRALIELGYEFRGQYGDQKCHYYAVLDRSEVRFCQVHLYTEPTSDWLSKLKFRDVLQVNEVLAKEYSEYKLELAKTASSKGEYAEIKTIWLDEFIKKVMEAI